MEEVKITIIGAGVVGLAIAAEIAEESKGILVIERHKNFGQETSSRNSEVIHSGIYYPKDSLKAKLCLEGKHLLYELCTRHQIPHQRIGKLIVAVNDKEIRDLEALLDRGRENGLDDLQILSKQEVKEIEPHINARAAIWSPSTGIIDTHSLMKCLETIAKSKGVDFVYGCQVESIEKRPYEYKVGVRDTDGERFSFLSRIVINSAGLYADKVAALAGVDIDAAGYRLYYCKGEYFSLGAGKHNLIRHLIYPLPGHTSLGIHAVLDLQGRVKLGPNAFYVDKIDYQVEEAHKREFFESIVFILPFVEEGDLAVDMAGIRPKLQGPDDPVKDFVISHETGLGLPGLINLVGIESPGLTASAAIARYVKSLLREM